MQKYDKRINLNWLEKILEWIRLKREISKLTKDIDTREQRLKKIVKSNGSKGLIVEAKELGIPVRKMNLEFKEKELGDLDGFTKRRIGKYDVWTNSEKKPRKVRSDKGGRHKSRLQKLEESKSSFYKELDNRINDSDR